MTATRAEIECPCGYAFPEELGRYGCPNCNGDAMSEAEDAEDKKTPAGAERGG